MTAAAQDISFDAESAPAAFLDVQDLRVHFSTDDGVVKAVDGLSFTVQRGQTLGIVGESGSGKSVTSQAILGLHRGTRAKVTGSIWLDGEQLNAASDEQVRRLRGSKMAMIFQDPLSSLHPFFTVGAQISEAYRVHNKVSKAAARRLSVEMLDRVGIPNPDKRFDDYAHSFSGGMRQRAMIAMALVCRPALLVADEPTASLDAESAARVLDIFVAFQQVGVTVLIATHDQALVARYGKKVLHLADGRLA